MLDFRDSKRLRDVASYAEKAVAFLGSLDADELIANDEKLMAILRAIEIVGEAASHVSDEVKIAAPDLPWAQAKRMRNLLIHSYPEIDVRVVVQTVREDFPTLIADIRRILEGETP